MDVLMRFQRRVAALVFVVVLSPSLDAAAVEMGPLAEHLPQASENGPWRYDYGDLGFVLENTGEPGAIQYYYADALAAPGGNRTIAVDVTLRQAAGDDNLAGMLYGFSQDTRHYFIYGINVGGQVVLIRRDANGFQTMIETSTSALKSGSNRLTIRERGRAIELFVNDEPIAEIESSGTGGGGAGIVGVGIGAAAFDHFAIDRPDARAPTPSPQTPWPQADAETPTRSQPTDVASLRLQPIQIIDEAGPFGRMPAYTGLLPSDWIQEGGIVWNPPSGCFRGSRLVWSASSPGGDYGIAFLQPLSWSVTNYGGTPTGCIQEDLTDAEAALHAMLRASPGFKHEVVGVERPAEVQTLVEQARNAMETQGAAVGRRWWDGVLMRLKARNEGKDLDVGIVAITHHYELQTPNPMGNPLVTRAGNAMMMLALSTPPGKLDEGHPAFAAILQNLREVPAWTQAVAGWWRQQRQATSRNTTTSSVADTGQSVSDILFEGWQRREAITDAGQRNAVDGIREVNRFQTSTGTVALPQQYPYAWELANGDLVITDDANFNPVQTVDQFGTELQRAQ